MFCVMQSGVNVCVMQWCDVCCDAVGVDVW